VLPFIYYPIRWSAIWADGSFNVDLRETSDRQKLMATFGAGNRKYGNA
jgi:hypothetical protein